MPQIKSRIFRYLAYPDRSLAVGVFLCFSICPESYAPSTATARLCLALFQESCSATFPGFLVVDVRWNKIDFDLSTVVYKWLCDHAVFVYAGFEREDGTVAPARPWVDEALKETDVKAIFAREYTRNAGNLQRAWLATVEQLGQRFQDMIMDERWEWDRETMRSDGSIAGSPRDARDTDELLNSQVIEFEP